MDESNLQYFGARYYNQRIGRFTQIDPIYKPTEATYHYANNNPLKFVDPTGMGDIEELQRSLNYAGMYERFPETIDVQFTQGFQDKHSPEQLEELRQRTMEHLLSPELAISIGTSPEMPIFIDRELNEVGKKLVVIYGNFENDFFAGIDVKVDTLKIDTAMVLKRDTFGVIKYIQIVNEEGELTFFGEATFAHEFRHIHDLLSRRDNYKDSIAFIDSLKTTPVGSNFRIHIRDLTNAKNQEEDLDHNAENAALAYINIIKELGRVHIHSVNKVESAVKLIGLKHQINTHNYLYRAFQTINPDSTVTIHVDE